MEALREDASTVRIQSLVVLARYADRSGTAPTWLSVGTLDLFAEEDMAYVFRPVEAGIPTESHLVPGVWHGFDLACPDTAISRSFHENHLNALRAAFLQAAPSPAAH